MLGLNSRAPGRDMTGFNPLNAQERKRARRLEIARQLYEALLAQNPDCAITLCNALGEVVAHHDPLPVHDAPEIASLTHGPTADEHDR